MTDIELEAQIDSAFRQAMDSTDRETQRLAFKRMSELIGQLSPERVAQMERQQGLA